MHHASQPTRPDEKGVRDLQILVSDDEFLSMAGFMPVGAFELAEASGGTEPAQLLSFTARNVRWVKFDIQSAHSGRVDEFVGLSEVRFVDGPIYADSFESE